MGKGKGKKKRRNKPGPKPGSEPEQTVVAAGSQPQPVVVAPGSGPESKEGEGTADELKMEGETTAESKENEGTTGESKEEDGTTAESKVEDGTAAESKEVEEAKSRESSEEGEEEEEDEAASESSKEGEEEEEDEAASGSSEEEDEEMEALELVIPTEEDYAKVPALNYGRSTCKRCQKLEQRMDLIEKGDDDKYTFPDDKEDFEKDHELKLRLIHHRRKKWVTGSFYADCQPSNPCVFGGIFHREHFWDWVNLDKAIEASVKFVLNRYKEKKGESLILKEILNTTVEQCGCWWFYVTFNAYQESDESNVRIYHTMVSNNRLFIGDHKVWIFRRKIIGQVEYEELLPSANSDMNICTTVKKDLIGTLDEVDREAFQLEAFELGKTAE